MYVLGQILWILIDINLPFKILRFTRKPQEILKNGNVVGKMVMILNLSTSVTCLDSQFNDILLYWKWCGKPFVLY